MRSNLMADHKAIELLTNKALLKEYHIFAVANLASENSLFLKDSLALKRLCKEKKEEDSSVQNQMRKLFNMYFSSTSFKEINFSGEERDKFVRDFQLPSVNYNIFRNIQHSVIKLIELDNFARFLYTKEYHIFKLENTKREFKRVLKKILGEISANFISKDRKQKLKTSPSLNLDESTIKNYSNTEYDLAVALNARLKEARRNIKKMNLIDLQESHTSLIQFMNNKYEEISKLKTKDAEGLNKILKRGIKKLGYEKEKRILVGYHSEPEVEEKFPKSSSSQSQSNTVSLVGGDTRQNLPPQKQLSILNQWRRHSIESLSTLCDTKETPINKVERNKENRPVYKKESAYLK